MPPSHDLITGVKSKDVIISTEPQVSTLDLLGRTQNPWRKFPLLLYIHGGGFVMFSAFDAPHHVLCNKIAVEANVIVVYVVIYMVSSRPDLYLQHATRTRGRRSSGWLRMLMGVALSHGWMTILILVKFLWGEMVLEITYSCIPGRVNWVTRSAVSWNYYETSIFWWHRRWWNVVVNAHK